MGIVPHDGSRLPVGTADDIECRNMQAESAEANGMRRKDREVVDANRIERILAEVRYLHLGMFDGEYPYVVPLHYGYHMDEDGLVLYVHCAKEGRKLDCLRRNDHVFVEIDCGEKLVEADVTCRYGAEYASVMGRGRAVILAGRRREARGAWRPHEDPDRQEIQDRRENGIRGDGGQDRRRFLHRQGAHEMKDGNASF